MINIRKLAAVDMVRLGPRIIIAEYALGVILPLILGLISISSGFFGRSLSGREAGFGIWLVTIAANYIPLFIYAVLLARAGTMKEVGQPEPEHAKRYVIQQMVILVPFLVVILALTQELRRQRLK